MRQASRHPGVQASRLALAGAVLCVASAALGRDGLTVAQLMSIRQVREVAVSPDGKNVAYTLLEPRGAADKPGAAYTSIWVMPFGAKAGRRYTLPTGEASAPGFTADGKRLIFLSKRGDSAQVWSMPLDGGEAEAMTSAAAGVLGYALSPDGTALAYLTLIPDPANADAVAKGRDERVVDAAHRHQQLPVLTLGKSTDVAVTSTSQTAYEMAWSPDGKDLAVMVAASPKNDDNYMFRALWRFPAGGGAGKLLVEKVGKMVKPTWAPDGKTIGWLGAEVASDATTGTIWTVPAEGGAPKALNRGAEETVYDARWLPTGKLLVTAVKGTHSTLSVRSLSGDSDDASAHGATFTAASLDKAGKRYAVAASSAAGPSEVYTGTVEGDPARATDHNPWLKDVELGKQETVSWQARDGQRLEGVLVHPVGEQPGKAYPLAMMVHGGPEAAALDGWQSYYLQPAQVFAAKGYVVLLPNYRGSAGRGSAFARADHKDLGGKEFDDNIDAIDHLAKQGLVDPKRVGMMGGSYGGYMSALAATKGTERFAAALDFAGITNWSSFIGTSDIPYENSLVHWDLWCYDEPEACWKASPMAYIKHAKTPLLVMHGANDERVPISQAWEIYTAFKVRGIETELVIYPREGHGNRERAHQEDAANRALEFFGKHLKPQ